MRFVSSVLLLLSAYAFSAASAFYSSKDAVIEVNPSNFKQEVLDTDEIVLAEFFAPWCGHCQKMVPDYKKAAEKLKGLVKVVAVDCDAHKSLCGQYQVQGFPTIKLFQTNKKLGPIDYQGPRTAKEFVDFAIDKLPSTYVKKIDSASAFDTFRASSDLPKVVLVYSKGVIPPLYKSLSLQFNKRAVFAFMKEKEDLKTLVGVTSVPGVVVFTANSEEPIVYDGKLKHAPLSEFLEKHAAPPTKPKKESKEKSKKSKPQSKSEPKTESKKPEPTREPFDPKIIELKIQSDLESECSNFPGVCVISFLTLESEFPESVTAHAESLQVLSSVKENFYKKPSALNSMFKFVWVNAIESGQQLMKDFDVSDILPGMLALSKRGVYRLHRGAWDVESIQKFLEDMANGKGRNIAAPKGFVARLNKGDKVEKKEDKIDEKVEVKSPEKEKKEEESEAPSTEEANERGQETSAESTKEEAKTHIEDEL